MQICHCIKLTTQEKAAIETVQDILHEMTEDNMVYTDFQRFSNGGSLEEIEAWFADVVQYLADFGFGE